MRVFSAAVAVLFSLIMIYGLQHFYAIESSYRVESEKQTLDQLREENRQLHLSEAELTQPGRIDQMARQLGLAAAAARPGDSSQRRDRDGSKCSGLGANRFTLLQCSLESQPSAFSRQLSARVSSPDTWKLKADG